MNTEAKNNWLPTPENIAALPEALRNYVRHLESHCDPDGIVRQNTILAEQNESLEALLKTYVKEEAEKYKELIKAILTEYIHRQLVHLFSEDRAFSEDFARAHGCKVIYFGNPIGGKSIIQALMLQKYASKEPAYNPTVIGMDESVRIDKDFWGNARVEAPRMRNLLGDVDNSERNASSKQQWQERSGAYGAAKISSKRKRSR